MGIAILRTALTVEAAQMVLSEEDRESLADIIERVGFLLSPGAMAVASPLGQEAVRTNSTEWDPISRRLGREASGKSAEQVLLKVAIEKTGNPKKPTVRVLHDIAFLGLDASLFDQYTNDRTPRG